MKRIILFLLFVFSPLTVRAQTNTARMLNGINAQTGTSYTFVCTDATMLVTFNSGSPVSATLFAATDPCSGPGIMFSVKNIGGAVVTITPVSGAIDGGVLQLQPQQGADLWNDGSNYFSQGGGVGGGGTPSRWDQLLNPNTNFAPNFGGVSATFSNGIWDWGTMNVVLPRSPLFLPSTLGQIGFDTTNANLLFNNNVSSYVGLIPVSQTINPGDLASFAFNTGQITLAPIPVNTSGTSIVQINITNPIVGDSPCITDLGPPIIFDNCTPGIPTNVQTGDYPFDPLNDRGTALIANSAIPHTYSFSLISDATNFDADWFAFELNKNAGTVTLTATAPNTFDSSGTQTETLLEGENVSFLTDPTLGVIYPKFSPGRITVAGPIAITRNPYGSQISCPTCGTGSGNLTGTLSAPHIPVATGANALADSTVTDDGTAPTRTPNGANTALSGVYDEWVVDTGGVTANKLVCRSSNSKVQICATSITQGVIGVAQATATSGQTVKVCWAAKCSPISSNATTAGHWLIPSTSVAGDVDDTGSTTQPTGTDTFLAESSVGGGAQVLTTLLAADTVNANGGGKPNTIQINGTNTQPVTNFNGTTPVADANNQLLVHKFSNSGNTTSASVEVPLATTGQAGIVQLAGALGGTSASPTLASPYNKLFCETGLGDGLNAMAAGTYLQFFCVNRSGSTWTITGINCWTDNNGTSTLNAANNAATGLLTGAVTCTNTKSGGGAAGTQSGTTTLANNDAISFTFVADGTSKQTTWTVSLTQ